MKNVCPYVLNTVVYGIVRTHARPNTHCGHVSWHCVRSWQNDMIFLPDTRQHAVIVVFRAPGIRNTAVMSLALSGVVFHS